MSHGGFLKSLVTSSKPGAKKLDFPYEIPPIKIQLEKEAKQTLYVAMGILSLGIAAGGVLNYLSRSK